MQVTETLSDGLRRAYAVVVPADEIEGKRSAKLADLGRTLRLPGFRPGKVPVNLVRQRYGSAVLAEVLQDTLNESTDLVISERGLRPAGQPRVALTGEPQAEGSHVRDLAFNVEVELLPEITTPDLSALSFTRLRAEPSGETVDKALATLAARQAELADVTEIRPATTGDVLKVDFLGRLDGVPFDGGKGEDVPVELGGTGFIPGFAEQLEGMSAGETRTIDVTFPDPYQSAELAGKAVQFEVAAKSLHTRGELPIDDSLAEKLGFENLAALRQLITAQMQREYDQLSRLRLKRELLDALAERADFPAPQGLVEAEFNAIWQRVEADRKAGQEDDEDRGKDVDTLRAEYRAIADRRVRLGLLLSEIGRANNIQVAQTELTQALRAEASRYPGQEMQVIEFYRKTPNAIEQLRGPLFEDKVVDFILELAQMTEQLVAPEALTLPPADAAPELAAPVLLPAPVEDPVA